MTLTFERLNQWRDMNQRIYIIILSNQHQKLLTQHTTEEIQSEFGAPKTFEESNNNQKIQFYFPIGNKNGTIIRPVKRAGERFDREKPSREDGKYTMEAPNDWGLYEPFVRYIEYEREET